MKLLSKTVFFKKLFILLFISLSFAACVDPGKNPPRQDLTNPLARKLVDSTCHFISKSDIAAYVERYQRLKKAGDTSSGTGTMRNVLSDSCSFNNNIVRSILADEKCIGLRVIYGVGPDNKLHVILVGIAPDYSTLYIKRPKENCSPDQNMKTMQAQSPQRDRESQDEVGGAEMGQMP